MSINTSSNMKKQLWPGVEGYYFGSGVTLYMTLEREDLPKCCWVDLKGLQGVLSLAGLAVGMKEYSKQQYNFLKAVPYISTGREEQKYDVYINPVFVLTKASRKAVEEYYHKNPQEYSFNLNDVSIHEQDKIRGRELRKLSKYQLQTIKFNCNTPEALDKVKDVCSTLYDIEVIAEHKIYKQEYIQNSVSTNGLQLRFVKEKK